MAHFFLKKNSFILYRSYFSLSPTPSTLTFIIYLIDTISLSLSLHSLSPFLPFIHPITHKLFHTIPHLNTPFCTLSHIHTFSLSLPYTISLSLSYKLCHSCTLSLTHFHPSFRRRRRTRSRTVVRST